MKTVQNIETCFTFWIEVISGMVQNMKAAQCELGPESWLDVISGKLQKNE
jgi:hypothetical protein